MNKIDSYTNNSIARVSNPNMESRMMNNYDPNVCDFEIEQKKAKRMTIDGLIYTIEDCRECVRLGINPSKYQDQISVYKAELNTRKVRVVR